MSGFALLAILLLRGSCPSGEPPDGSTTQSVSVCSARDATAPSAASPEAPNDVECHAPVVPRCGPADGSRRLGSGPAGGAGHVSDVQLPDTASSSTANRKDGAALGLVGRWVRRTGEAAAASGWVVGQWIRSGQWGGEAIMAFDRDSSRTDVGDSALELARSSSRAEVALRNPSLVLGRRMLIGNLGLNFALSREVFTVSGRRSPGTGRIAGYDVGMTALPDRNYSVGVFAARNRIIFPRLFGTAREQWLSRRGAVIRLRGPLLDSTIDWTRVRFESSARTDRDVQQDAEDRDTFTYTGTRQSARQTLALEHRRERRTDLLFPDLSFPYQVSKIRHSVRLDEDVSGRTLVSSVGISRRGGAQPRDHRRAETRVDFRLTPALDTRTSYRGERVSTDAVRQDRQTLDSHIRHRLYESLVTTLAVRGALENLDTGRRTIYGIGAIFDYRKKLPAGGRLSATASRRYDRENNQFGVQTDVVLGELHEARLGAPFRLEQPRLIPGSIVVTNTAQTTIFRDGFDYAVDLLGEFVEVRILPGGRIEDGQLLLVDYRIRASAPATSTASTQPLVDLSVDYGWINPYVRLHAVNRRLLSGANDGSVFDRRARAAGVRFRWSRPKLRVTLRNEHRTEDARDLSFSALQFGQAVSYSFQPGRVLTVDLDEIFTEFRVPDRREWRGSGRVAFRWRMTPVLSVEANATTRLRRDRLGFDETFNQAGIDARWERQPVDLVLSVTRDWGDRAGTPISGLRVGVQASRAF